MANPYFVLGFAFLQGNDATFSNSCYLGHIPWWTGVCVWGCHNKLYFMSKGMCKCLKHGMKDNKL